MKGTLTQAQGAAAQAREQVSLERGRREAAEAERADAEVKAAESEARVDALTVGPGGAGAQLAALQEELAAARAEADKAERLQQQVRMLEGALQSAKAQTAAAGKVDATRVEAEAKLTQTGVARAVAEAKLAKVEASLKAEQAARKALEAKLATSAASAAAPADWESERERLQADLANLKRKLMAAETALENAAGYKAKIARLEAQLKGKK